MRKRIVKTMQPAKECYMRMTHLRQTTIYVKILQNLLPTFTSMKKILSIINMLLVRKLSVFDFNSKLYKLISYILRKSLKVSYIVATKPTDCEWNEWHVGMCSRTCGPGTRSKTRTKKVQEKYGGTCEGGSNSIEYCNLQDCPSKLLYLAL